ncbi:hypothetical protein AAF712_016686, partial [Marasmius tenuissimus]
RKLARNTGRNPMTETESDLALVAQGQKLPIPAPLPSPQHQRPIENNERSQVSAALRADGIASGRNDLDEVVERAVEGLRSQLNVMAQRVAQLENELAEQAPPDYTSSYSPSRPSD